MRKITIEDLYSLKWVVDPQISPCGSQVAFTQTIIDEATKEYRSQIYIAPSCGSEEPRKLTGGSRRDSSPRWSPCGSKIAFVSDRSGEGQIWVLNMAGGEATQLTTMRYGASNPVWSPDGKKIAFTARMHPTDELDIMFKPMPKAEKETEAKFKRDHGLVVESLQYRSNDAGFLDGRYAHIWVMDLETGKIIKLTDGKWHHASFSWSPCSTMLVLAANRNEKPELNPWDSDIYTVPVCGGELKKISDTDGPCAAPVWSPDGTKIAYLGHKREYAAATISKVWVMNADGTDAKCLTTEFDQGFGEGVTSDMTRTGGSSLPLIWAPCSKTLIGVSNHFGQTHLYKIGLDSEISQITTDGRSLHGYSFSKDFKALTLAWADFVTPNDISVICTETKEEKRLTHVNCELLSEIELSKPQEFWYDGDEGWKIQGWLMKPVGWKEGQSYPMILDIHGGPHAMFGVSFFHEFQVMASQGYYVLFTNPRGATGYGQVFQHGVNAKYGEGDYRDLMLGVDYVLEHHKDIDAKRLGVTGGSYGGFMTNWIVGHTDRFAAAVTQRSISNWFSFFGVSDIGFNFCDTQLGGNPLTDAEAMVKFSPITYIKNCVTPLLILHSEQDYRCPIEQGEQMFVALKKLDRDVKMVRFNNATHELSRSGIPALRIDRLTHMMSWFNQYIDVKCEAYEEIK